METKHKIEFRSITLPRFKIGVRVIRVVENIKSGMSKKVFADDNDIAHFLGMFALNIITEENGILIDLLGTKLPNILPESRKQYIYFKTI